MKEDNAALTLIKALVRCLVDDATRITVAPVQFPGMEQIRLTCSPDDYGKVIGAKGSHFKALERLATAAAARQGKLTALVVPRPEGQRSKGLPPFRVSPKWSVKKNEFIEDVRCAFDCLFDDEPSWSLKEEQDTTVMSVAFPKTQQLPNPDETRQLFNLLLHAGGKAHGRLFYVA